MRRLTILLSLATLAGMLTAQVTIGTDKEPVTGALLQLKNDETVGVANAKGGLGMPRVYLTTLNPAIGKLAESIGNTSGSTPWDEDSHIGLAVYNVNNKLCVTEPIAKGLYTWDGSRWQSLMPVNAPYPTIASVSVTPSSVCPGSTVSLSGTVNDGATIHWYTTLSSGTPIGTGTIFSVIPTVSTTYYAEAYNATNDCTSSVPRTAVEVPVIPLPTIPNITGVNLVDPNSTNITYTSQTGMSSYTWTVTGGTITSGQGTASINVSWGAVGSGTVTETYTNASNCSATNSLNVTIGCGAYTAPGVWKQFRCYNVGVTAANLNLDPLTPVQGIFGDYYQWGRITTAATATDPATPAGAITNWDPSNVSNRSWNGGTEDTPAKTLNDPCPEGYRVPTNTEWQGVIANNVRSSVGTWVDDPTNFSTGTKFGNSLFLPATGYRAAADGALVYRGHYLYYWSSTFYSTNQAWYIYYNLTDSEPKRGVIPRPYAMAVRCIAQ